MLNLRSVLRYDAETSRIDITPALAVAAYVVALAVWVVAGDTAEIVGIRLIAGLLLVVTWHMFLQFIGSTLLASVVAVALALLAFPGLSSETALSLSVATALVLLWLMYFRFPARWAAFAIGPLTGLVAALTGSGGRTLVVLFIAVLAVRIVWHVLVERLSKRPLVMFFGKAVVAGLLAVATYMIVRSFSGDTRLLGGALAVGDPNPWLLAVAVVLALRGLWATLLLKTARSPLGRGSRWFVMFIGLGLAGLALVVNVMASDVFLPEVVVSLDSYGLVGLGLSTVLFALLASLLLVQAGVERSLYKDTELARSVLPKLGRTRR